MMNCDDWKAFAHDYVYGDLNVPARELLDRHAASCASCLNEARQLQFVDRRLRQEPVLEPPAGLWKRALEAGPARQSRELWRVAATLLLAGGIGVLSATSAFASRLPDEIHRAPKIIVETARFIPSLLSWE